MDTSTSMASVALFDGRRVVSETTWLAGREHSSRLLIEVQVALERLGASTSALTGLVVARGPGSFTGVRVALSIALGIGAALQLPVWGVSTLDVLAAQADGIDLPVRATVEAGRGRYITALYRHGVPADAPRLATAEQLGQLIEEPTVLIGELSVEARHLLARQPLVRLAPAGVSLRRAGVLAELGWRLAQAGDPGDPRRLDALYVS
jgi:tRNA threonylcarbamoyladenosine biosynthesis protein TsaB